MTLHEFAEQHRLKVRRHDAGEPMIPGRLGHLYAHDEEAALFGLALIAPADDDSLDNTLRARRRKAVAAWFEVHQEGDFEAILLFNASDPKQARLAVRLVEARKARKAGKPTEAQLRARALFAAQARTKRPPYGLGDEQQAGAGDGLPEPAIQALGARVGAEFALKV